MGGIGSCARAERGLRGGLVMVRFFEGLWLMVVRMCEGITPLGYLKMYPMGHTGHF